MADIVQADYDQLISIKQRFGQHSEQTEQLLTQLRGNMENLMGEWIGDGSEAFFQEMNREVLPAVGRLANALEVAGVQTEAIRLIVKKAEEEGAHGRFCKVRTVGEKLAPRPRVVGLIRLDGPDKAG